jgi:hypothetical protein
VFYNVRNRYNPMAAGRQKRLDDSGDGLFLTYEEIFHNYVRKLAEFHECPIAAAEARSWRPAWLTTPWALQKLRNLEVNTEDAASARRHLE